MRQPSLSFFFSCHNSPLQFCETRPHFKVLLRTELSKICISNGRGVWKWSCWKINVNSITKHCDRSWTFNLLLFVNVVKLLMSKEQDSMLFCLMLVKIKWERLNDINVNSITKHCDQSWTFNLIVCCQCLWKLLMSKEQDSMLFCLMLVLNGNGWIWLMSTQSPNYCDQRAEHLVHGNGNGFSVTSTKQ